MAGGTQHIDIGEVSVIKGGFIQNSTTKIGSSEIGSIESTLVKSGISQDSINQDGIVQSSFGYGSSSKIGSSEIGSSQLNGEKSISNVSPTEVSSLLHFGSFQVSPFQVGSTQVDINKDGTMPISSTQVSSAQVNANKFISLQVQGFTQIDSTKVSLPSLVTLPQFSTTHLTTHDLTPEYLSKLQSTLATYWNLPTNLNLTFAITNLPTGQLAEATITGYDTNGRPNAATISIDDDANGVGWFLDPTPDNNSEFRTGTGTYFTADPNSEAAGKYDLLTAILHEMGHTLGFINGYSEFNKHINGNKFITDTGIQYTLSSDLSHLDNTLYTNDLLNTNLKPGVRKLPSTMDWAIIDSLAGVGGRVSGVGAVNPAHLTASALQALTNGDFTTTDSWNIEGATNILNGTATLTEQSQKLSQLTQAFTIPTGAKRLQFTILDNHLIPGDTTKAANDAFEVALLDTNTSNPLAGTIGLSHSDSLLNIQANGTTFKSDKVTIVPIGNKRIVTIDVSDIDPNSLWWANILVLVQ